MCRRVQTCLQTSERFSDTHSHVTHNAWIKSWINKIVKKWQILTLNSIQVRLYRFFDTILIIFRLPLSTVTFDLNMIIYCIPMTGDLIQYQNHHYHHKVLLCKYTVRCSAHVQKWKKSFLYVCTTNNENFHLHFIHLSNAM